MSTQTQRTKQKWLCAMAFLLLYLFLLWRAPYGYIFNDEPFCVTLAQRLYQGDGLVVDEWHGTQNFGVLLLPFFSVYYCLFHSTEGMLLVFRYVFCHLWIATALAVYRTLRGYKWLALAAAVLCGQLLTEGSIRLTRAYWDAPLSKLTASVQQGPAKGVLTTEENKAAYDTVCEDLRFLLRDRDTQGKSFLCYSSIPWVYLAADMRYATFSAWTFGYEGDGLEQRLRDWYALDGHDLPDYIFVADWRAELGPDWTMWGV